MSYQLVNVKHYPHYTARIYKYIVVYFTVLPNYLLFSREILGTFDVIWDIGSLVALNNEDYEK